MAGSRSVFFSWAFAVACGGAFAFAAAAADPSGTPVYRLGAVPAWVDVIGPQYEAPAPGGDVVDSAYYLLLDRQIDVRARGEERYQHFAVRLINDTGAEDHSQLTLYVDPSYQRLTLHWVRVFRGGKLHDRLAQARVTVLPVESELQKRIYSGEQSVSLLVPDLRAGDLLDYAYSIDSVSPSFPEHFYAALDFAWSEPVLRQRIRVSHLSQDPVKYRVHGGSAEPVVRERSGRRELEFNWSELPARRGESDVPDWYPLWAYVEFSDIGDWNEVAARTAALYQRESTTGPLARAQIAKLRTMQGTDADRALAALRMVQDEIRYASISIGPGSYRPNPPDLVLERNFGDCKDKSLLVVNLLRAIGVDAKAALVHTSRGDALPNALPTPRAFDHAIVRVNLGPRVLWLDPTVSLQRGSPETISQADFRHALVIDSGTTALERIPRNLPGAWSRDVQMIFDLKAGVEKPGSLEVRSQFAGRAADSMRSDIASRNRAARETDYLNFYAGYYPGIEMESPITVEDDPLENVIVTRERYKLARGFYKRDPDLLVFELHPDELYGYAATPETAIRTAPVSQPYPAKVSQSFEVRLPEPWSIESGTITIDNPAFRYKATMRYAKQVLKVEYRYESLGDLVPLERVPKYLADLKRMSDDLGFELTYGPLGGGIGSGVAPYPLVASLLGLLIGAWIVLRLTWRYDPPPRTADTVAGTPAGIAGWLIVPALNVVITVGFMLAVVYGLATFASTHHWHGLSTTAQASIAAWAQHGVAGLLMLGLALLPNVLAVAVLFFRKRTSAPTLVTWMFWVTVLYFVACDMLTRRLVAVEDEGALPAWAAYLRDLVFLVIWTCYLQISQRVRATFVRRLNREAAEAGVSGGQGALDVP
ncbi:MAG: DUF3857 domain-containing protein [Steroidobacteraceae bacterium]